MTNNVLEELAPNTNFVLEEDFAVIKSNIQFDEDNFNLPSEELNFATPLGKKINEILPQLIEQGLVEVKNGQIFFPYETFDYLYKSDSLDNERLNYNLAEYLPKYSPFFLDIKSFRDLGSAEFKYDYTFYWGTKGVYPQRIGCFLIHKSKFYYLEKNLFDLLSKMDEFNLIDNKDKNKIVNLKEFAKIKELIKKVNGVETDKYIENENVINPTKIRLNIKRENDNISIEPLVDGVNEDSFSRQFANLDNQDVYDTDVNGKRTRVVIEGDVKLATQKLKNEYSNRKFSEIEEKIKNPRMIFSELEGIDQDIIECTGYGERVKGIGEYAFKPSCNFNSSGVGFFDQIDCNELSEEKFHEIIDKFKPVLTAQTIDDEKVEISMNAETIKNIEEAVEKKEDLIKLTTNNGKEVNVPINEEIKTFVKDNRDIFSSNVSVEEKKKKIKKYLLIHDNFEELTYSEHQNKLEEKILAYHRPLNLKESLVNKKGDEQPLELYEYQKEGVAWLEAYYEEQNKKGVLLADDMGLGKTLQVLTFLAWMIEKKEQKGEEIKPILIVAPPILLQNWYDEIMRFFKGDGSVFWPIALLHGDELRRYKKENIGPESLACKASLCVDCKNCELGNERGCRNNKRSLTSNRIVITNYDTVKNYQFSLGKVEWMCVVLDEAQSIKEPETAKTYAIKQMNAEFKLAITGTPVENKMLDLWSIMDFASPGLLGSKKDFLQNYDITNDTPSEERVNRLSALKKALKLTKFKGLNKTNIIPYIVRREKCDYLADKLPKKYDGKEAIRIECEIPNDMIEIHQALVQQALESDGRNHLMVIGKLRALYQHKCLLEKNKKEYSIEEYLNSSPKLIATLKELEKIETKGEKVLIFATSIEMQSILKKVIDKKFGLNVGIINGEVNNTISCNKTSKSARYKLLESFEAKEGFNVLILSPHVAGIGLTILGANHVIHYGRWWNPAKESQATDRAYRIGQDKEVYVYYPVYKSSSFETFDEKLDRLIEGKKALAKDFLTPIENLEVSASEILLDFAKDTVIAQKTSSSLINIETLSETEFKNLIYLLLLKEKKNVFCLKEESSCGIDLILEQNELIKTYTKEINELNIDEFVYNINKFNKKGHNYIYTSKILDKNVLNYIKENNIIPFAKKDIEALAKKHKISKNDLLSLVPKYSSLL